MREKAKRKAKTYHYEGGIKEFVKFQNQNKDAIHPDVIYFEVVRDTCEVEIAMQYTESYNELVLGYANNINTTDGGTHIVGFKSALTRIFNDYGKKAKILKENDTLSGEDVREGLTAIVSVKLAEPQFEGQTKDKAWKQRNERFRRNFHQRKSYGFPRRKSGTGKDNTGKMSAERPEPERRPEKPEI